MKCILVAGCLVWSVGVFAVEQQRTQQGSTQTASQEVTLTNSTPWEQWGLSQQDWDKYLAIMDGPRGIWSPNISPLTALGVHASSERDRLRYARIAATIDYGRIRDEAHWQKTYDTVKDRVWGELQANEPKKITLKDIRSHHRVTLITDKDCGPRCRRVFNVLVKAQAGVDIYFAGNTSNQDIQLWAEQQGIHPDAVNKTRQYTLNPDRGLLQQLGNDISDLPLLMIKKSEGFYEEISL